MAHMQGSATGPQTELNKWVELARKWRLRAEHDRRVLNAADADYDVIALAVIRLLDKLPSDANDWWKKEYNELYNLTVEYRE